MQNKLYLTGLLFGALALGGCSYFTINGSMCDQIASDPHATIPKECKNYNEEEAQKAFDKTKHDKQKEDAEVIRFQKEQE